MVYFQLLAFNYTQILIYFPNEYFESLNDTSVVLKSGGKPIASKTAVNDSLV